jgi:hypothetical protein
MEASIPWIFWLFPIVFAVHNIEEALWLPKYSKTAGKYHKPVETFEFVFALVMITLLATIITVLFYMTGKQSIHCYLFFAFNFGMFINVFFPHFAATIALKRYCPGLLTGIMLLAPTTVYLLLYGYNNGYFDLPKFWLITIPFAALVVGSIPILFKVGRYIKKTVGLRRSVSAAP